MELKPGMKVYIHADDPREASEAQAHGVQDQIVIIEAVFDTYAYIQRDRPELGQYRDWHGSTPIRHIKMIVSE